MKTRQRLVVACLASLSVLAATTHGQEPATDPKAAFTAAFEEFKAQARAIEAKWTEFQTADGARSAEIEAEYQALIADTQTLVKTMEEAALDAYLADPNSDQQVTDVLVGLANFKVVGKGAGGGADQYESALPILKALVEGGCDKPEMAVYGVLAAVATNDFDLADQFAKAAIESGAVGSPPKGRGKAAEETFAIAMRYLQEKDTFRKRWEAEQAIREAEAAADDLPRVKIETSKGDVVIELFEDQAPTATANFLSLVKDGFYDGIVFHRVLQRFMAQGGDPTGSGSGGPGHAIACECYRPDARKHFRGTLSMAHAGRNTGGSQFFLCFVPTDHLDGKHTAFGRVVEGMDVLGELQAVDPDAGGGELDKIEKATVVGERGHAYEYEKLPSRR